MFPPPQAQIDPKGWPLAPGVRRCLLIIYKWQICWIPEAQLNYTSALGEPMMCARALRLRLRLRPS